MPVFAPYLLFVFLASGLPSPPDGYRWEAIPELSDEFNGTRMDQSKWTPNHPYWKGRQPSRFSEANVSIRDGRLELRSTTRVKQLSEVKNPQHDVWVDSACLSSKTPIAFYGYYEARMKASQLSMSSSFWFQGKYSEIDVAEQFGDPTFRPWRNQYMLMDTHFSRGNPKSDEHAPAKSKMSSSSDQYHVYGIWWKDKSSIVFYLDGKEVQSLTPAGEFLEPMYLFFDTEVFQDAGLPSIDSLNDHRKNTMYVDWVHGWKLVTTRKYLY
jgi:beta-glucanase (GH16 family)